MEPERWQQIDKLLDEALDQEPGQRKIFLEQACNGDAELCKEVETLLAAHDKAGSFVEKPALDLVAKQSPQSLVGRKLGPYEILSLIGRGGMGEVYHARDTRLDRINALKILPIEVASDPDRLHRFVREAKAASALNHPNIATIYEIGESDGIHWIAMELVEGQTLAERMKDRPLEMDEILDIDIQAAEALEEAHLKGITHRDIKPANIMLNKRNQVKVLDFGLAKITPREEQVTSTATQSKPGLVMGTLPYMSPEQVLGHETDHRTDIFSLGVVLYEMAAGRLPFHGATAGEIADDILHVQPQALTSFNPEVPPELDRIVRKCLEKDREHRYQFVRELWIDLNNLKKERQSIRLKWLEELSKPKVKALLLVSLLLVVGVVSWLISLMLPSHVVLGFQARDWILITDFGNQTGEEVFDRSLEMALTVGIQQSRHVNVFPRSRIKEVLKRMRRKEDDVIDESLGSEIALREGIKALLACSVSRIDENYLLAARIVDPKTQVAVLTETSRAKGRDQVLNALDVLSNKIRQNLGESLSSIRHQDIPLFKATTSSLQALKNFTEAKIPKGINRDAQFNLLQDAITLDPDFALAHVELGIHYYYRQDSAKREEHFAKALSLLDRLTVRERLWIQALVEEWRGHRAEGISGYKNYVTQYPDDAVGWFRLGYQYLLSSQYAQAIEAFTKTLEIDHAETNAYINIATCQTAMGRSEEAISNYQKAFEMNPDLIRGDNINYEYGFTLVRMGQIQKAAETFEKMFSGDNSDKARGHRSLAWLNMYLGKYSAAIDHLKTAILLNVKANLKLSEMRDHLFLARAYRTKGLLNDSLSELTAARRLQTEIHAGPSWLFLTGQMYARAKKKVEATQLLSEISARVHDPLAMRAVNDSNREDQAHYHLLQGEIQLAKENYGEAFDSLKKADQVLKDSTLESLAYGYLLRGDSDMAIAKYQELVSKSLPPREGLDDWILSHYQLGKLYEQKGQIGKAKEAYGRFVEIWKEGDPDIPALKDAKQRLTKLKQIQVGH